MHLGTRWARHPWAPGPKRRYTGKRIAERNKKILAKRKALEELENGQQQSETLHQTSDSPESNRLREEER